MSRHRAFSLGFTLVELVLVMILVGVLSTVAIGKFSDQSNVSAPAYADQIRALMRFAQKLAIAQNRPVYVIARPTFVAACFDAACASRVTAPGGSNSGTSATTAACGSTTWYCEAPPTALAVTPATPFPFVFYFSPEGRPFLSGDSTTGDTSTFTSLVLSVTGSTAPILVTVEAETGYVH